MVQLGGEGAKFFEKHDPDLFKIVFAGSFRRCVTLVRRRDGLKVTVQANGFGLIESLPLGSAQKDGNVPAANRDNARRDGFGLQGRVNSCENNGVLGDVNDYPATGEVSDEFIFLSR